MDIPLPALRFPEPGWRERFDRYVKEAARAGLELEARLEGEDPLRGRIGHLHFQEAGTTFASDYAGTWERRRGEAHEVVFASRDAGEEHRFTSLGTFLESMLVRAYAEALHRKAEADAGDDLDDRPWLDAARALELRIDPKMHRTRED